jgi:hypothetical protein
MGPQLIIDELCGPGIVSFETRFVSFPFRFVKKIKKQQRDKKLLPGLNMRNYANYCET